MGNTRDIGMHEESRLLDYENDNAHRQNTSLTFSQEKVSIGSESKKSLTRNALDAAKDCAEKLSRSGSAEEFAGSSIVMVDDVIKTGSKETQSVISEVSKDSCDQRYMEWIKLRGSDYKPRNRIKESSEAQKLKCWADNELFLDKVPEIHLDEIEPADLFEERQSIDLFSYVDSDSFLRDARDRDEGSTSYTVLSELSVAVGSNRNVSATHSDLRKSDSRTLSWAQEQSSDESVKHLYAVTCDSGFEKGKQKHSEFKESTHRIEFKPSIFPGCTQLKLPVKKSASQKVLRPRVKVNHRSPVLQHVLKTD